MQVHKGGDIVEEKLYSIKEAAKALGVSPDTIRRRIKKGELTAEKLNGPYGMAYYVTENELAQVREIREVVPFNRPFTEEKLKRVVREAVSEEIGELKEEVAELRRQLEEARMIEGERRPWWKFWGK